MRRFMAQIGLATFVALAGAYALAYWMTAKPPTLLSPFLIVVLTLIVVAATLALLGYIIWLAFWERETHPTTRVLRIIKTYLNPTLLIEKIGPMVLTFAFLGAFGTFKALISAVQPFYLDAFLADLDRAVFRTEPWRLTHALIGPIGTRVIDVLYGMWFPAWVSAVAYFSLFASIEPKRRFFLSFFAVWGILGVVLAIAFSSAGPCFLDLVGHPYASRFHIPLQDAPGAMAAQAKLATAYKSGLIGVGAGISAMPSVHVAVASLLALAVRGHGRMIFTSAVLFWMVTFLGSVHLGWHYVSDGVVGTLAAMMIWRATK